jgi:hypothetical protein
MNAIRICRHLDSETLYLPELRPLLGKHVEIVVREENGATAASEESLRQELEGTILRDDDPFAPVAEADWEALA